MPAKTSAPRKPRIPNITGPNGEVLERVSPVARRLGISPRTLQDWVAQGRVRGWKLGSKILLVAPDEVAALLEPVDPVR